MEDNPIYGNVSYTQTSKCFCTVHVCLSMPLSVFAYRVMHFSTGTTLFTEADPPHSSNQPRVNSDSQVDF